MGGIRDHLGGGFHRYSVDRYWRIPHFEKMLYDNGQLASVYAQAWELTSRDDFRRVASELCDFVLRELTDTEGGFYSALDADSEGEEGKFYRWDKAEVEQALTADEFTALRRRLWPRPRAEFRREVLRAAAVASRWPKSPQK